MTRFWLVAQWEFACTVKRVGFVGTLVALPLFHLGIGLLLVFSLGSQPKGRQGPSEVVVVDPHGVLTGPRQDDVVLSDERAALQRLQDGRVAAVFVLGDDYLETGRVRQYAPAASGLFRNLDRMAIRDRARAIIRRGLLPQSVAPGVAARAVEPAAAIDTIAVDREGRMRPDSDSPLSMLTGAFGVCLLLSISIFMSSSLLQQAMLIERQNRVLEVLLVSVRPLQLMAGKVLGLAAAGLLQIVVYAAFVFAVAPAALGAIDLPLSTIGSSMACFFVGYLLFACLMAGTGALGRGTQESTQIATIWMLCGALPLFFVVSISADGASTLARALSWFPLTAPIALMLRVGGGAVSPVELAGALLLTLVTAAAALYASAGLVRRVTIAGAR
jgi:ABC-2 type transport system permease protein